VQLSNYSTELRHGVCILNNLVIPREEGFGPPILDLRKLVKMKTFEEFVNENTTKLAEKYFVVGGDKEEFLQKEYASFVKTCNIVNFKNGSKVADANILSCKGEILPSTSVNTVTRGDKGYVNVNGTFSILYSDGTTKQVDGKVQIRFKDFVNVK
jgi:hypothetical protein